MEMYCPWSGRQEFGYGEVQLGVCSTSNWKQNYVFRKKYDQA